MVKNESLPSSFSPVKASSKENCLKRQPLLNPDLGAPNCKSQGGALKIADSIHKDFPAVPLSMNVSFESRELSSQLSFRGHKVFALSVL